MTKPVNATLSMFILFILFPIVSADLHAAVGDSGQDEAIVWVNLDISNLHEEIIVAGDPPVKASITTDINFTIYGFYTLTRQGGGTGYLAMPGRGTSRRMPQVMGLSIRQSHPCQDDQALIIGRETRTLTSGRVRPGWIRVEDAGGGRIRLQLTPSDIEDVETVECSRQGCYNLFGVPSHIRGLGRIGEDPEASIEDEHGYVEDFGYDLIELDWNTLKEISKGGELPLTIPIEIEKSFSQDHTDTWQVGGDPVQEIITYRVRGWIGAQPEEP